MTPTDWKNQLRSPPLKKDELKKGSEIFLTEVKNISLPFLLISAVKNISL